MPYDLYKEPNNSGDFMFLSYKKENVEQLRQIVPHFDFDVWYDKDLEYGKCWMEGIATNLRNCVAMLLFLSKASFQQGELSPAFIEYCQAKNHKKDVYVVFLEDISIDDIPPSLEQWFIVLKNNRCLFYDKDRSNESILEDIHRAVSVLSQNHCSASAIQQPFTSGQNNSSPLPLEMRCISSFNNEALAYVGSNTHHISHDGTKICLYNHNRDRYEIRMLDDINRLYGEIKGSPTLLNSYPLFYTADGKYCFHYSFGKLSIYDFNKKKWLSTFGTKLPLRKNEEPTHIITPYHGNTVYLIAGRNGQSTRLFKYNIASNRLENHWDLDDYGLKAPLKALLDKHITAMIFTNKEDRMVMLDFDKQTLFYITPEFIEQYCSQDEHIYEDVDDHISHDGKLYSIPTSEGFRVLDTVSRTMIHEEYYKQHRNLYLLKNRIILRMDNESNVWRITASEKKLLFSGEMFRNIPAFRGQLPHTMLYDEVNNCFIFLVTFPTADNQYHRVVVTDNSGRVLQTSNDYMIPFSGFYCTCCINRGELMVFYYSPDEPYKKHHNTVIFTGTYR